MASGFSHTAQWHWPATLSQVQHVNNTTTASPPPALTLIGTPASNATTPIFYNSFAQTAHQLYQLANPIRRINDQQDSLFLSLPAELRNEIYKELLCPDTLPLRQLASHSTIPRIKQDPIYPTILSTCRKIHTEASSLLYSSHIFHAHASLLTSLPHLTCPSRPLVSPSVIGKVRRWQLVLRLDTDPRFTARQATAAFSGAEYVKIHVWQSSYEGCDASVLRLFRGVRGVGVARVSGCNVNVAKELERKMVLPVGAEEEKEVCCCCGGSCGSCGGEMICGRS